jgi:hypothetical protein
MILYRKLLPLCSALALMLLVVPAMANDPVVRVLFYTGDVTVKSGGSTDRAKLGQSLTAKDEVTLSGNATLQLSINGKVIKYSKPMKLRVADAIKRAGQGENLVVANTLRTLAAASGADRSGRTSVAGATRADDTSHLLSEGERRAKEEAASKVNSEVGSRIGIEDPLGTLTKAHDLLRGEQMVILEPRSTAVEKGGVQFRWLRNADAQSYVVSVKNYTGDEIFRIETKDTMAVWESPQIAPEAIYNWSVEDPDNALRNASATFHQLSDAEDADLKHGISAIRKELGESNPALPLMLGAFYSDKGCYGEAARCYTEGALKSQEHFDDFMSRAIDEYQYNMSMPENELQAVYRR